MVPPLVQIPLTKGYIATVDEIDGDLNDFKWTADTGSPHTVYAFRANPKKPPTHLRLHRVILERVLQRSLLVTELVDHINRNGLDNRRENLRIASPRQNKLNAAVRVDNTSGYRGVRQKRNRWSAEICVKGQKIHLGCYTSIRNAVIAYNEAAQKYFGEFAFLNEVPPVNQSAIYKPPILGGRNTSGFRCVTWNRRAQKWQVIMTVSGHHIFLGRFTDIHEAARAYNKAAIEHFGESAILNEVPE